jgi:hypothetical protein
MSFWHSRLVWQPLLGLCLKENFVMPHIHKLKARGMDAAALAGLKDVIHFDTHMVAKYHRYVCVCVRCRSALFCSVSACIVYASCI